MVSRIKTINQRLLILENFLALRCKIQYLEKLFKEVIINAKAETFRMKSVTSTGQTQISYLEKDSTAVKQE
jgi:hypothetical protein